MNPNSIGVFASVILLLLVAVIAFMFLARWKRIKELSLRKRHYNELKRHIVCYIQTAARLAILFRQVQNAKSNPLELERINIQKINDLFQELKELHILIKTRLEQLARIGQTNIFIPVGDFLLPEPIEQLGVRELEAFALSADQKKSVIFQLMDMDL